MSALGCECPPLDGVGVCAPLPLAFVRLRYFFGKRMGVADFIDEQLYHAAKLRFHNQRLHGAGVVCGLRTSTLGTSGVRVSKGAAIDRCGREIIVGIDQCIDVDAWIARELAARQAVDPNTQWPKTDLDADGKLALCAVLRYRECSSSPEAAPRDPCSCEGGGSDFGRVREGFELDLRTEAQAREFIAPSSFPSAADLAQALAASVSGAAFTVQLAGLLTAPAPDPTGRDWLLLSGLKATLDNNQKTTALEFLPMAPPLLLETGALQELLLRLLAVDLEPGALVDGAPQVLSASLSSSNGQDKIGNNNKITLPLTGSIVAKTLGAARLAELDPVNGWKTVTGTGQPAFVSGPPAAITVDVGTLSGSRAYRLTLARDPSAPVCDQQLRPLLPLTLAWSFTVDGSGNVEMASFA